MRAIPTRYSSSPRAPPRASEWAVCGARSHVFDLVNEVKGLLEPLRCEETKRNERAAKLEVLMAQWNEVFGEQRELGAAPRTPLGLLERLEEQERTIEQLGAQLDNATLGARMTEASCRRALAQREAAHRREMADLRARCDESLERTRECNRVLGRAPLAVDAADAAGRQQWLRAECERRMGATALAAQ